MINKYEMPCMLYMSDVLKKCQKKRKNARGMEHLKQLYGAAALGVAAVLFAGISGTEVIAQELENAADKAAQGAFEYLYLEERGSSDTNEMKIVIQLSDSEEALASAQL